MVRVGGGWDTLDNYLLSHDPCRVALFRKAGGPADNLNVKSAVGAVEERGYKSIVNSVVAVVFSCIVVYTFS